MSHTRMSACESVCVRVRVRVGGGIALLETKKQLETFLVHFSFEPTVPLK